MPEPRAPATVVVWLLFSKNRHLRRKCADFYTILYICLYYSFLDATAQRAAFFFRRNPPPGRRENGRARKGCGIRRSRAPPPALQPLAGCLRIGKVAAFTEEGNAGFRTRPGGEGVALPARSGRLEFQRCRRFLSLFLFALPDLFLPAGF